MTRGDTTGVGGGMGGRWRESVMEQKRKDEKNSNKDGERIKIIEN
jgi:hypothetical protein